MSSLLFAVLLFGVFGLCLFLNLNEIDGYTMPIVVIGGVLFIGSGVWSLWLWWRGRGHHDLESLPLVGNGEPPQGMLQRLDAGRGLLDRADESALYATLDEWWRQRAAQIEQQAPGRIEQVWRSILQQKAEDPGTIPNEKKLFRRSVRAGMPVDWKERRYEWSPR